MQIKGLKYTIFGTHQHSLAKWLVFPHQKHALVPILHSPVCGFSYLLQRGRSLLPLLAEAPIFP
jgi:hypothetical protein